MGAARSSDGTVAISPSNTSKTRNPAVWVKHRQEGVRNVLWCRVARLDNESVSLTMMGAMISRGRVAVVLGRRGFSILLLAVGVLIAFLVTLRAVPSEAQADCREVASIGPETANQRVGPVQIRGDTIRVEGEVTASDPDRFTAFDITVEGEGEDGLPVFDFVSITHLTHEPGSTPGSRKACNSRKAA